MRVPSFVPLPCSPDHHPILLPRGAPCPPDVTTVTVEIVEKWYGLIIARQDSQGWFVAHVEFPDEGRYEVLGSPYVDHVPNPAHVLVWANRMGYHVDPRALEVMLGRWVLDADGDPTPTRRVMAADDKVPREFQASPSYPYPVRAGTPCVVCGASLVNHRIEQQPPPRYFCPSPPLADRDA